VQAYAASLLETKARLEFDARDCRRLSLNVSMATSDGRQFFLWYVSIIIRRVVTDIGEKLMKIASYNLGNDRTLNIGTGVLRRHASAFTGFSSFLLSRGSMAAAAAK